MYNVNVFPEETTFFDMPLDFIYFFNEEKYYF